MAGSHPGITDIDLSPEPCPYSKKVEEARQQDLFECLEAQQSQATVLSDFILGSNWAVSLEEVLEVNRLCKPIDCSVDYEKNVQVIQNCLALDHIVTNVTQHFIGRYLTKINELSGETRSSVHRDLATAAEVQANWGAVHHTQFPVAAP